MVIANYFKDECDVNTSIRQAFEKGFRIGVKKGAITNRPQGEWIKDNLGTVICSECKRPRRDNRIGHVNFCNSCGARMKGTDDESI
jgi:hypothetical protein